MEVVPLVLSYQPTGQTGPAGLPPGTTALSHIPGGCGGKTSAWTWNRPQSGDHRGSRLQPRHDRDMHKQTSSCYPRPPLETFSFNEISQLPLGKRQHCRDNPYLDPARYFKVSKGLSQIMGVQRRVCKEAPKHTGPWSKSQANAVTVSLNSVPWHKFTPATWWLCVPIHLLGFVHLNLLGPKRSTPGHLGPGSYPHRWAREPHTLCPKSSSSTYPPCMKQDCVTWQQNKYGSGRCFHQ